MPRPAFVFPFLLLARAQEDGTCPVGDPGCVAAAPAQQPYFWPQQKGDINRTGWSPFVAPFDLSGGPTWTWHDPHFQVNRHTPLIDNERNIYFATVMGRIYKFSASGELLWEYSAKAKVPAVPSIMDGLLFHNREDGAVVAISMRDAEVLWERMISNGTGSDTACVFALDGLVISATQIGQVEVNGMGSNNAVVALHAGNGSQAWVFRHRWPSFNFQGSAPGDGSMLFQDRAGGLYKLDLASGALLWESGVRDRDEGDFSTGAAVVGGNGLVYVASNYRKEGIIHAYRLADGVQVWRRGMGMEVNQAVAVARLAGSERLSVVAGIGDNPWFPAALMLLFMLQPVNLVVLCCCTCRCCCRCCKRRPARCCRGLLLLLLLFAAELPLLYGYHMLSLHWQDRPGWLFFVRDWRAAMVALDAETGATRWSYTPPKFAKAAAEGDEAALMPRLYRHSVQKEPGDPICLPDNWAQCVVDAAGTTYGGHQDGYLYAVRDEDGSGSIEEEREVSRYYLGHCFQASQAMAPGMLAVAPCGGGLHVWSS